MASIPEPVAGMVIRYSYLWRADFKRGQEEGEKDRPCAIVLVVNDSTRGKIVTVLPITHNPPGKSEFAVELPENTKRRLRLDDERSWVVLTESNRFRWPGPDIRRANPRDPSSFVFGQLPYASFIRIREGFLKAVAEHRSSRVDRTE